MISENTCVFWALWKAGAKWRFPIWGEIWFRSFCHSVCLWAQNTN